MRVFVSFGLRDATEPMNWDSRASWECLYEGSVLVRDRYFRGIAFTSREDLFVDQCMTAGVALWEKVLWRGYGGIPQPTPMKELGNASCSIPRYC